MSVDNIVGGLLPESENKKVAEMQISLEHGLQAIRDAVWRMAKQNLCSMDPNQGLVQVFFPGPVLNYERQTGEGSYLFTVWLNGGRERHAQRLCEYLELYASQNP